MLRPQPAAQMTAPSIGYLELLRQRPYFRRFFLGEVVSFFGDWFNTIALLSAVAAITPAGGLGKALAGVMVAKHLPAFLISPFSGPLVDRFDRRRLLLAMDFLRALGSVGLIVSFLGESLLGIYFSTVVMMACAAVAFATKNAVTPMLLDSCELPAANAISGGTWSVMLALGSAAGGLATYHLGIVTAFAIDGATFLLSAFFFAGLPRLIPPATAEGFTQTGFVDVLRYLARTPYVLALVTLKPMMGFAGGMFTLLPLWGTRVFASATEADSMGYIYAARGVGAAIGALLLRTWIGDAPQVLRRAILCGFTATCVCYGLLAWAPSFAVASLCILGAAVGSSTIWVFSGILLQWYGDRRYHGRLFALEFALHTMLLALSSWVFGSLYDAGWNVRELTSLCAILVLPSIAAWSFTLYRTRHGAPGIAPS